MTNGNDSSKKRGPSLGGIVHTYQKYDPAKFPSPTQPPPDFVSPMLDHLLAYGSIRELTEEELARAVHLDPSQFQNLGPSIDMIRKLLLERKRRILETYETESVVRDAKRTFVKAVRNGPPAPPRLKRVYQTAVEEEQVYDLEQIWYEVGDDQHEFSRHLVQLMGRLGDKYQIDELASKYLFTGRQGMTIPEALEIKEELEKIDELLRQLDEAEKTAQIAVIDLEQLSEFVPPQEMQTLEEVQRTIENFMREIAERQGIQADNGRFQLTPQAYRIFQGKLLKKIFEDLQAGRFGRHSGDIVGEGTVELPATKDYEFGDSLTQMDVTQTLINAMVRGEKELPIRLKSEDFVIHKTRNNPKSATVIIMDMSGSMRYDGQYINVKRMALAMDGLIRSEYPGDYLGFIEMATFAKVRRPGEIVSLMPKPVTLFDPFVQLKYDMGNPNASEHMVHPHFTNIQHALSLARKLLANQSTPNRQIVLITDGLPTAHFEDQMLYMLYPPHPQTEQATLREGQRCNQEGITINMFLIPSWSQSEEDIRFAQRLSQQTGGRVFFSAGGDLDRFVVWDYVKRKREILG
ncbi:MAG: VWA domain-containing protein [Pirellulaceae bacterium]|nr:VWA domain-containing protein [Pirellulaceae bacterium]